MNGISRETQCTSCIHRELCKYTDLYLEVIKEMQKVIICSPEKDSTKTTPITSLNFLIQPVDPKCKYYSGSQIK